MHKGFCDWGFVVEIIAHDTRSSLMSGRDLNKGSIYGWNFLEVLGVPLMTADLSCDLAHRPESSMGLAPHGQSEGKLPILIKWVQLLILIGWQSDF